MPEKPTRKQLEHVARQINQDQAKASPAILFVTESVDGVFARGF